MFTEETNAQLSFSHLAVLESLWNFGFRDLSLCDLDSGLIALPQEDLCAQG